MGTYAYLKDFLERLPTQPASRISELLPHRWRALSGEDGLAHNVSRRGPVYLDMPGDGVFPDETFSLCVDATRNFH